MHACGSHGRSFRASDPRVRLLPLHNLRSDLPAAGDIPSHDFDIGFANGDARGLLAWPRPRGHTGRDIRRKVRMEISDSTPFLRPDAWTRTTSLTAAELEGRLAMFEEGQWILEVDGPPPQGVEVIHYEYATIDGKGAAVTASAALMLPRQAKGDDPGPSPLIVALHGTMPDKVYNLADLSGDNQASPRALAWAALYAARGYIVVAPNFTGLDTSSATHQSYLDADQQSQDVLNALSAARELLALIDRRASEKQFVVGYSQGGWLTMAVHRKMEALGLGLTASAPMSGPYALTVIVDELFQGRPPQGSTIYLPLAIRAYQEAYGDIYDRPSDAYNPAFADDVATLLPNTTPHFELIQGGRLPATAVFSSNRAAAVGLSPAVRRILETQSPATEPGPFAHVYAAGFGPGHLLNDDFRIAYLADAENHPDAGYPEYTTGDPPSGSGQGFRRAVIRNDLRGWTPRAPMLMCGGQGDAAAPIRYGGALMMRYWADPAHAPKPGTVSLLDFDAPEGDALFAGLKSHFQAWKGGFLERTVMPAWADAYHQLLLPRYCYLAARLYFEALS